LMNRKYTAQEYLQLVRHAKEQIPEVGFSSDIIVGFPGETFEEYQDTERLVKQVRFTQLFTFIYSKRIGTKAAEMPDNVSYAEKTGWLNRLIKIQQDIFSEYLESFKGKRVKALVDSKNGNNYTARLENTLTAHFECDENHLDKFVQLEITGKKGTVLTAVIL
ncbi:MAG: radical SAM protein, partial [Oscillospiraceae bacterium]